MCVCGVCVWTPPSFCCISDSETHSFHLINTDTFHLFNSPKARHIFKLVFFFPDFFLSILIFCSISLSFFLYFTNFTICDSSLSWFVLFHPLVSTFCVSVDCPASVPQQ